MGATKIESACLFSLTDGSGVVDGDLGLNRGGRHHADGLLWQPEIGHCLLIETSEGELLGGCHAQLLSEI